MLQRLDVGVHVKCLIQSLELESTQGILGVAVFIITVVILISQELFKFKGTHVKVRLAPTNPKLYFQNFPGSTEYKCVEHEIVIYFFY